MKRRDFIRNMMIMGMGLALAPEVIAKQVAEAAWQDGGNVLPGASFFSIPDESACDGRNHRAPYWQHECRRVG